MGSMKVIFGCLFVSCLFAKTPETKQLDEYFEMMQSYSSSIGLPGHHENGEIELLKDPEKIAQAMKKTGRDVGIIYKDRYWTWINDPVQFPNGNLGVYGRILSSSLKQVIGCAVVPVFADGHIALNCNFRHATRTWELEIPRGFTDEGETLEEGARREVLEETGLIAEKLLFLGDMTPDTGQSSSIASVFFAEIQGKVEAVPDESEAIESIVILDRNELREGLKKGSIMLDIRGTKRQVFLRDPFLTFALIQMQLKGIYFL